MKIPVVGPGSLGVDPQAKKNPEIREAAEAFEALFLQTLLKKMREAQLEDGLFGKTAGSSIYEGMFDQMVGERMAEGSPLGIADALEARWSENPEKHDTGRDALRRLRESAAQVQGAQADE